MKGYAALARSHGAFVGAPETTRPREESFLAVVLAVAGGVVAGRYCSKSWPAHPVWGFVLGYSFIGSPIGGAVGRALSK